MKTKLQKPGALLLALMFIFGVCLIPVSAAGETSGSAGDGVTWTFDEKTGALTIAGSGAMNDYYNSESAGSKPSPWFDYSFQITKINIADGVTRIGDYAFYKCYYLQSANIPESVTSIGNSAFDGTGLYYNKSFWQNGLFVLDQCVLGTDYLSLQPSGDYQIPDGIRLIADYGILGRAFGKLSLPASVHYIGLGAFYFSTMDSITVDANNPNYSAEGAVLYNKDKTEIAAYLESDRDTYLTEKEPYVYQIPAQVTRIGQGAFLDCTNLFGVVLPVGLKSIGKGAFQGCTALDSLVFPEGLTDIEPWAFSGCNGIKTVELPKSLKKIGEKAFYQCKTLENVNFKSDSTDIGAYCFAEDPALTAVTLPKKIDSIANYLFQGCTAIKSFVIPNAVKTIGSGAFSYCTELESVTIPKSVENIKEGAFYETALTTVEFLGSQAQWDTLKGNVANYNEPLLNAQVTCLTGWKLFVSRWNDFWASVRRFFLGIFRIA